MQMHNYNWNLFEIYMKINYIVEIDQSHQLRLIAFVIYTIKFNIYLIDFMLKTLSFLYILEINV